MEKIQLIQGQDYFTANSRAFFRVTSNRGNKAVAAKLFILDEDQTYSLLEEGVYALETIARALQWKSEKGALSLQEPINATT